MYEIFKIYNPKEYLYLLITIRTKPNNSLSNNEPWGGILAFIEIDKQLFACFLTVKREINPSENSEYIQFDYNDFVVCSWNKTKVYRSGYTPVLSTAYVKKTWTLLPVTSLHEKFSGKELDQDINMMYIHALEELNKYNLKLNNNNVVCFFPETNEYKPLNLLYSKIYYNSSYWE